MSFLRFKNHLPRLIIASIPVLLAGCAHHSGAHRSPYGNFSLTCAGNAYLTKYGCSIEKIQRAAEDGNPDAQYALGYMYYYGISTVRDQQTASLWIKRSAEQGQPLAKKALRLINSGAHFNDLHHAASAGYRGRRGGGTSRYQKPADVAMMNATQPADPISDHLPGYNRNKSKKPVLDVLKKAPANTVKSPSAPPLSQKKPAAANPMAMKKPAPIKVAPSKPVVAKKPAQIMDPRLMAGAKPIVAPEIRIPQPNKPMLSEKQPSPSGKYTLQLMASYKVSDVKSYMKAHQLSSKARYYRTKLNGKSWYFLTYGEYQSFAKAKNALKTLPSSVQKGHPWIKSMQSVRKEIKLQKVVA